MKNFNFREQILPHILCVLVFYIVTLAFFQPAIFSNKSLDQHDIMQWRGASKELIDYYKETGEVGLWANSMFSGMPAYLVQVHWSDAYLGYFKNIVSLGLPHPVSNTFLAFVSFYVLLIVFGVRPMFAAGPAIAYGLSSFLIIGVMAGHNARVGAMAFAPLVIAGIHLVLSRDKKLMGATLAALGLSLHFRENHLQVTYYILLILLLYGILYVTKVVKEKNYNDLMKSALYLLVAGLIAVGTFAGKFWTIMEYSQYSIRGKSELTNTPGEEGVDGLSKTYAFEYSNGILEPLTLLIPDFYGGNSSNFLVQDRQSSTFKALSRAQDKNAAQQLVNYTSSYWGNQRLSAPYYAGAIICFLFAIGVAFAEKKYKIWLIAVTVLGIVLSWGDSFSSFNYFLFDYLPGYNKFRSVTFAIYLAIFAMPLLGALGLEKLGGLTLTKELQKKFIMALGIVGGFCLLVVLFAGMFSFQKQGEGQLPTWFLNALADDRESLMRSDALRSLAFIAASGILIFLYMKKMIGALPMSLLLIFLITVDHFAVSKRYLTGDHFKRTTNNAAIP
ncbi:MAG: hypothetical protein OEY51_12915, partial [Cyclobacteriaceae bacterium]|nr:hypothetical protein [Cyclobacteriaceae bacterium]